MSTDQLSFDVDTTSLSECCLRSGGIYLLLDVVVLRLRSRWMLIVADLVSVAIGGDGQTRTSLASTPSRPHFLAAKMIAAGAAALIGLISIPVSAPLEQWASRNHQSGRDAGLVFTARMALNVGTVALNYILIALIAFAFTTITHSVIATLVVMIPMVLGLTIGLVPALPALKYLPDLAGIQLLTHYPRVPLLAPLPGALVMTAWAAILTAASTMLFAARDVEK